MLCMLPEKTQRLYLYLLDGNLYSNGIEYLGKNNLF